MVDPAGGTGGGGFLPPKAPGPEPDLGPSASPAPSASPPPTPSSRPTAQQQLGWNQAQQPPTYTPGAPSPDNGAAVAGLVLSIVGGGLLLISIGISSVVSAVCAGLGIFYARRGRQRVDRGETRKHRDLAQAGFITGIVVLVLSLLATAFWILVVVLYATSDEFRREIDDSQDFEITGRAALVAAVAVARLAL